MNLIYSSEVSLRSAVFNAQKTLEKGENLAEKIKLQALSQMDLVQQAEGLFNGLKQSESLQSAAIHLAVKGIEIAYQAIKDEMTEARFKRKQFVEECETYLAAFTISKHKEYSEFSTEELAVLKFYEIIQKKCPDIVQYFGIHTYESPEFPNEQHFAVLPFYRMSLALQQNGVIANKIDAHRQSIYLFLKTGLPLEEYYTKFKNYSRTWLQFQSLINAKNYLNHLRAPRFIISALANLLWNLQHPVNTQTGIPLTLSECVSICHQASMFLNELLNSSQFEYLQKIDNSQQHLFQSVSKTELLIKSLQNAFEYDKLHEINLNDISKHMHSALRIMSSKLLELIYQDELASEKLVGQIMIMGELLMQNHDLYTYFHPLQIHSTPRCTNKKARTLIDVITLFAHQTPSKRNDICRNLIKTGLESHIQLAYQLKEFHQNFLDQFEGAVMLNFKITQFDPKDVFKNTARHFIPLIILVMESFTVFRDTRPKKNNSQVTDASIDMTIYDLQNTAHDRQQRLNILDDAASNKENYYHWSLSKFLESNSSLHESLDELLSHQNAIRLRTQEIDLLAFEISENRILLLQKDYKLQLNTKLEAIYQFFNALSKEFNDFVLEIRDDIKMHRDQKRVLHPMLDELDSTIIAIQKSISLVGSIIKNKKFDERERERIAEHIGSSAVSIGPSIPNNPTPRFYTRAPMKKTNLPTHIQIDQFNKLNEDILSKPLPHSLINLQFFYQALMLNFFLIGLILLGNTWWPIFALSVYSSLQFSLACLSLSVLSYIYVSMTPDRQPPLFIDSRGPH